MPINNSLHCMTGAAQKFGSSLMQAALRLLALLTCALTLPALAGSGTWTTGTGIGNVAVNALAATIKGPVFAGTAIGIYRTNDSGLTWAPVNNGLSEVFINALVADSNSVLYAGTNNGIFKSTDAGLNWTKVSQGLKTNTQVMSLALGAGSLVYAGTQYGVFKSTDGGGRWTLASAGLPDSTVRALAVDRNGLVYAGTNKTGMYLSENGGASWVPTNNGLTNTNIRSLAIDIDNTIYAGTDCGGLFRSSNSGGGWQQINNGLSVYCVYAVTAAPTGIYSGHSGVYSAYGDVYRISDIGRTFSTLAPGLNYIYALTYGRDNTLYAATPSGVFQISLFPTRTPVYRLAAATEHFHTADRYELSVLLNSGNFTCDGATVPISVIEYCPPGFYLNSFQDRYADTPIYRILSRTPAFHFLDFTYPFNRENYTVENGGVPIGWGYSQPFPGTTPLYALQSPDATQILLSADNNEKFILTTQQGWKLIKILAYVYPI